MPKTKAISTEKTIHFFFIEPILKRKNSVFYRKIIQPIVFGLIFASVITRQKQNNVKTIYNMKKTLIIALCSIAVVFAACKKPVEPTPTPEPVVDYTTQYVGNYLGQFTFTIVSMNNEPQSNLTFPIDSIRMDITKGDADNTVVATVTVDNETHQTQGTATEANADFGTVHLVIDKPDQHYSFNLDLKMEGSKAASDTLNIVGSFTGKGAAEIMGQEQIFDEVSGTLNGKLLKQ